MDCLEVDPGPGSPLRLRSRRLAVVCLRDSRPQGFTSGELLKNQNRTQETPLGQQTPPQDVGPFFRRNFISRNTGIEQNKNRGFLSPSRSQPRLGLVVGCGGGA